MTSDQSVPLFVERNTPAPYVPAKRFGPLTTRQPTSESVKAEPTAVQLVPSFVERNRSPPAPAKRFVPFTRKK